MEKEKILSTKEISPNVFLIKKQIEEKDSDKNILIYEVQVKRLTNLEFTANFAGSTGIKLDNNEGLLQITEIGPFSTKIVAILYLENFFSLKSKFKYISSNCSIEIQEKFIKDDVNKLENEMKNTFQFLNENYKADMNVNQLRKVLKDNKIKFIDPEFPPIKV